MKKTIEELQAESRERQRKRDEKVFIEKVVEVVRVVETIIERIVEVPVIQEKIVYIPENKKVDVKTQKPVKENKKKLKFNPKAHTGLVDWDKIKHF
jgi:hypothetical protein